MQNVEIIVVEDEDEFLTKVWMDDATLGLAPPMFCVIFYKSFLKEEQLAPRAAQCCEG